MNDIILSLIAYIQKEKEVNKIEPSHVTSLELRDHISQGIDELKAEGKIRTGQTANHIFIVLKNNQ